MDEDFPRFTITFEQKEKQPIPKITKERVLEAINKLTDLQIAQFAEDGIIGILLCKKCGAVIARPIGFDDWYNKHEEDEGHKLHICSCVSGGIYKVYFECPNCHEEIDLM